MLHFGRAAPPCLGERDCSTRWSRNGRRSVGRQLTGQFSSVHRPVGIMSATLRLPSPLRVLLVVAACVAPLTAFPNGAPTEACLKGMVPNHRGARSGNPASMPFSLTRQSTADGVRVTIQPLQANTYFKGFMVMAREQGSSSWAKNKGEWQKVANVNLLSECSSITHADRSEKSSVSVTWKGDPNVALYATIVQSFETFWSEIPVQEASQQQFAAPQQPQQQQQFAPPPARQGVVTNRPFQQQFAPVVDQSHFNIQEFFRQQ